MTTQFDAVVDVLQIYLDGLYHSDTQLLRNALHPGARYVCATADTLIDLSMEEYFPIVDERPSPAGNNQRRADEIVSIEFAGPKTAAATLRCVVGERHFTDFLTLVLVDGRWQVISKVFHYDVVEQAVDHEHSSATQH